MVSFTIETTKRTEFVNITAKVQAAAKLLKDVKNVTVFIPHTTAGIIVNESTDPEVRTDLANMLEKMAPWKGPYGHAEGNSAAHIKACLLGASVQIILDKGRLQLGKWQAIYFCEFDGPRKRQVWVG